MQHQPYYQCLGLTPPISFNILPYNIIIVLTITVTITNVDAGYQIWNAEDAA